MLTFRFGFCLEVFVDAGFCFGLLQLMCKMLPLLGRDVAERVFLDKFCEICASESNVSNVVREACPPSLCDFCAVVSPKSFEKSLVSLGTKFLEPSNYCC